MNTKNLSTLKIHKLTKEQYERELAAGRIDENALYLTPDEDVDLSNCATVEQLQTKADVEHEHQMDDVVGLQEAIADTQTYTDSKIGALGALAKKSTVAKSDLSDEIQDSLDKADSALQSYTETDPTVPAWAKEANKPTYTASEVGLGNVNNTSDANKPVSAAQATAIADAKKAGTDAQDDIDTHTANKSNPHGVTAAQVGAEANGAVSTHNASTSSHSDIRDLITALTTKLNNFLDVDDTTTDQLSEVLTLIENNKGTLESLTSSKVNVSDVVNNLTTNVANKPLSAAQGVAIKALIDALDTALDEHGHAIADVSGLQTALNGKAASGHNHDDKYYTETEVDAALSGKADSEHDHAIADVTGLQSALDGKADSSHGTHVSFDSTNKPKMDGTAAFGTSSKVARADHVHPTDTSRASQDALDELQAELDGIVEITSSEIVELFST